MSSFDDDDDEVEAIVIDNGSWICKAGFAGDAAPRSTFPEVCGRARQPGLIIGAEQREAYVGNSPFALNGIFPRQVIPTFPIERGLITHWEEMEHIWKHTFFTELRVAPEAQPVLLMDAGLGPKATRERMTRLMFETFNVPALYIACQPVLALFATGRITGCVLESGDGVTHAVAIYEGYALPHTAVRLQMGGRDVADSLAKMLAEERGYQVFAGDDGDDETSEARQKVRQVKEDHCYVALDFEEELNKTTSGVGDIEKSFEFKNETFVIGQERFRCPELLFRPSLAGFEGMTGVADAVHQCIMSSGVEIVQELFQNIILSGGNTLFPGFCARMSKEITALQEARHASATTGGSYDAVNIDIEAPPERKFLAWLGGSTLVSLPHFQSMWIQREDYDRSGPGIVHQKCSV